MSTASLLLGIVLATLYGSMFHLWRGGGPGKLLFYIILSWIGFFIGQMLANSTEIAFDKVGELHIGLASLGSIIFIGLGYWLSMAQAEQKK